ncbi:MAG: hypothetical protein AAB890_00635 [Patescibacteria group bacterium]
MALTKERKGEIALAVLKARAKQEGFRIYPGIKRELGNLTKETGIPVDELEEYIREFALELLNETFPLKQ